MLKLFIAAAALAVTLCPPLTVRAGTLISGKPLPSSTTQYDLSVNAAGQHSPAKMAGERNAGSTTGTDYLSISQECRPSGEIDFAAGSATIYGGPAILCGYIIITTPGTAASTIDDASSAKIPMPVSFPVGSYDAHGAIFFTSIKLTRGASGTGKAVFMYRPLDISTTQ